MTRLFGLRPQIKDLALRGRFESDSETEAGVGRTIVETQRMFGETDAQ